MEVGSSDICVIVRGVPSRVLPGRVPLTSSCASDIINLIGLLGLSLIVPVSLWLSTFDLMHVHLITNELGWGDRPHLNFRKVVSRVEGVGANSACAKLHALWRSALNVSSVEVGLGLVQADVKCGGRRSCDVPVGVLEFRFVHLLGSVELRGSAYKIN